MDGSMEQLGERIVERARLAVAMHLHEMSLRRPPGQGENVEITGRTPVLSGNGNDSDVTGGAGGNDSRDGELADGVIALPPRGRAGAWNLRASARTACLIGRFGCGGGDRRGSR